MSRFLWREKRITLSKSNDIMYYFCKPFKLYTLSPLTNTQSHLCYNFHENLFHKPRSFVNFSLTLWISSFVLSFLSYEYSFLQIPLYLCYKSESSHHWCPSSFHLFLLHLSKMTIYIYIVVEEQRLLYQLYKIQYMQR